MRLSFLGGAREIGASSALLEIAGKRILVDAGMRLQPQKGAKAGERYLPKLGRIRQDGKNALDLVVLTHAHLDHLGAVPVVAREFPEVPFITSEGTFALMRVMLPRSTELSARLSEEDPRLSEVVSKPEEVVAALRRVHLAPMVRWFSPFADADIRMALFPAGHILGAAMVAIEGEGQRVLFTGDFSVSRQVTVPAWEPFEFAPDVLVSESTYGCEAHPPREQQQANLAQAITKVIARGGRVLIPAFAVGRSQEVLALLHRLQQDGAVPPVPVYYDGSVRDTTRCYVEAGALAQFSTQGTIHPVSSRADREAILADSRPCVIVASSGNLAGGASVAYAKRLLPEGKNAVFFSGYQDEEAPGRALIAGLGQAQIKLDGGMVAVRAEVVPYQFSAHADGAEVKQVVAALDPKVVVLNHGEWKTELRLAAELREERPVWLPDNRITFDPLTTALEEALKKQYVQASRRVRERLAKHGYAAPVKAQVAVPEASERAVDQVPATAAESNDEQQKPAIAAGPARREARLPRAQLRHRDPTSFTLPELLAHLHPVQEVLGVQFEKAEILLQALTHRSFINESRVAGLEHNERYEFLGDAVIEYVVTRQLLRRFPGVSEGQLTTVRALLVCAPTLSLIAERLGLEAYILTSRGERKEWDRNEASKARRIILANALEAVVGAIHEDRGLGLAELFIEDVLFPRLEEIAEQGVEIDPKSAFQEVVQDLHQLTPKFRVASESGPDHDKWFKVECVLEDRVVGRGEGANKQAAEVAAATDALEQEFNLKVEDLRVKLTPGRRTVEVAGTLQEKFKSRALGGR